eukprot:11804430-Karenia_brevis.AAC.1
MTDWKPHCPRTLVASASVKEPVATYNAALLPAMMDSTGHAGPLKVFTFTSDGGPDVSYLKKILLVQSGLTPSMIFFGFNCKMHAASLIAKS